MAIINFIKIIRNNWKKSAVGVAALCYSVPYGIDVYNTQQLMRQYCEEVSKLGDAPLPTGIKPRHITVILNPAANRRKAKKLFEKYCEPLLHLAGIAVTIIQTESEGQARSIINNLDIPTDGIIVAGGDGTVCEVVTGLMRKYDGNINFVRQYPIGIVPLGQSNRFANTIYHGYVNLPVVRAMADATVAAIKGNYKFADVMEITPLEQDSENLTKPVYTVGSLEWGAWQDAYKRMNKYWYYGNLKQYATYVFNGYKKDLNWECNATLQYTKPCMGCSHCYHPEENETARRWWQVWVPSRKKSMTTVDYSKVKNNECGIYYEIPISTTELDIKTANVIDSDSKSLLKVQTAPKNVGYLTYVLEGWKRLSGQTTLINEAFEAKNIKLKVEKTDVQKMFHIDNEEYEVKSVQINLIPQAIKLFCPESET